MDSGYIYGIYNDINMKHYIGQTKHTPEQRLSGTYTMLCMEIWLRCT